MKIKEVKTGTWITTKSGNRFDFANPTEDMLKIEDIAGALSKICRFGGHGRQFYSVAEHCINVARCTEALGGDRLSGLLHDAQEAYCGDQVTPLKSLLPQYQTIEASIVRIIAKKWKVDIGEYCVKESDRVMLWAEALLLVPGVRKWPGYKDRPKMPVGMFPLSKHHMNSSEAEWKFLQVFKQYSKHRVSL